MSHLNTIFRMMTGYDVVRSIYSLLLITFVTMYILQPKGAHLVSGPVLCG